MASIFRNSAEPRREKQRNSFHLPLSAWLSYLFIATLLFGSVSLARFTASTSGMDTARAAKFSVSAAVLGNASESMLLNPSENSSAAYIFTVENQSEVVTEYRVIVSNVPVGVRVTLKLDGESVGMGINENEGTFTWTSAQRTLEENSCKLCELSFTAYDGAGSTTEPISVQIQFDQAD